MSDRTEPALDDLDDRAATRAEPLPEERAVEQAGEDRETRESEATEILRDSEERVADAAGSDTPADAADEHRRSEETA
ncbi:hypothetical protein ACVGVM_02680 [Pseudonocardia bannensis]|uniref:Uncharacterized protein n=1 Tax=Pseudonocardia bannensis TaxID=630973 RepID=A0A848DLQ8_9PSEU|nr:hypothetical protein [Pseudonocardia bannensis]NMH93314.1 hypothetical protein [Pseudonocardia bannensis]